METHGHAATLTPFQDCDDAAMAARDVVLVAALAMLAVGVLRDVIQSERDKGPSGGPLGGTFRPSWYLAGGLLLALVAWGNWQS